MKRMPFQRPTTHYDEGIIKIDEELCELIKRRREISDHNPGFPPLEFISKWSKKFELYEDLLNSVFGSLWNEELFRPMIEPEGFRRYLPVLKSIEIDNRMFSITFIRQYTNSSIINFNIDWDSTNDILNDHSKHPFFELFIAQQYNCRMTDGAGSEGHLSYNFIVFPPLPDNISNLDLVFKEGTNPYCDKSSDLEIVIHIE